MLDVWYSHVADLLYLIAHFYFFCKVMLIPRKGSSWLNYAVVVGAFYIYCFLFHYVWIPPYVWIYAAGSHLFIYILMRLLYRDRTKRILLAWFGFTMIGLLTDVISSLFLYTLFEGYVEQYIHASIGSVLSNMGRLLSVLVGEMLLMVYMLVYYCVVQRKQIRIFIGFLCIPVYQCFLMTGYFLLCDDFSSRVANIGLAMALFNLLLDGVILYFLQEMVRRQDMEEELLALEEKRRQEYAYYEADSRYVEEMRKVRHDFANQLQSAYGMMDAPENTEKVKRLLEEMKAQVDGDTIKIRSDVSGAQEEQ